MLYYTTMQSFEQYPDPDTNTSNGESNDSDFDPILQLYEEILGAREIAA